MKKQDLLLWISVLGGPIVWLLSFEARFALVPWACTFQSKMALFGVLIAALVLCGSCAMIGWQQWKALGENPPTSEGGAFWRSNFMAVGGMVLSAGCSMILIAQAIPEFMLGPCQ
jgi:hypothetical protein